PPPRRFGEPSHSRFRRRRGFRGRHINLRRFAQPLLELPHRLPGISHHLGQATRAEHQQDDDEADDQLAYAPAEHGRRSEKRSGSAATLVILWPDRLRQDTAPSTAPPTPLTARRALPRRPTLL